MKRQRQTYRQRGQMLISAEQNLIEEFQELCWKERKSMSVKFTELMQEELQKNEVGQSNPLNISYGLKHIFVSKNRNIPLTLDRFIDSTEAKELINEIPNEALGKFFNYNVKKLSQQVQLKQTGKITV